jgi:hypothetical protein
VSSARPDLSPGDIVQVTGPSQDTERWRGALVEVESVRSWGIVGTVWAPPIERGQPPGVYPVRFEFDEITPTGGKIAAATWEPRG